MKEATNTRASHAPTACQRLAFHAPLADMQGESLADMDHKERLPAQNVMGCATRCASASASMVRRRLQCRLRGWLQGQRARAGQKNQEVAQHHSRRVHHRVRPMNDQRLKTTD
eukprot:5471462-Prymnesium_polylepis.1